MTIIARFFRNLDQLVTQRVRLRELTAKQVVDIKAAQHWEKLRSVAELTTQFMRATVGTLHVRRRITLDRHPRNTQQDL